MFEETFFRLRWSSGHGRSPVSAISRLHKCHVGPIRGKFLPRSIVVRLWNCVCIWHQCSMTTLDLTVFYTVKSLPQWCCGKLARSKTIMFLKFDYLRDDKNQKDKTMFLIRSFPFYFERIRHFSMNLIHHQSMNEMTYPLPYRVKFHLKFTIQVPNGLECVFFIHNHLLPFKTMQLQNHLRIPFAFLRHVW